jgi:hypothetical protein
MIERCQHCIRPFCERTSDCILRWRDAEEPARHAVQRWPVLYMQRTHMREGRPVEWTAGELARRLSTCQPIEEKRLTPGWLPVAMKEGTRRRIASCVASVWALVCDLDQEVESIEALWDSVSALGLEAYAHTTFSHSLTRPKARVVFPFSAAVPAGDWKATWAAGSRWAESWGATVDQACKDPCRLYYLPSAPPAKRHLFRFGRWSGARLHWRRLCADYPEPPAPRRIPIPPPTSTGLGPRELRREQYRINRYDEATLKGIFADLGSTPQGQRNPAIFRAGCRLGRMARMGRVDAGYVEQELINFVQAMPGVDRRDITTAQRAIRAGLEDSG